VSKRWKEDAAGRKSFPQYIQSLHQGLTDINYRNAGILLEETMNELLLELVAACDGTHVTAFQVEAILLDEHDLAAYCGLHDVFAEFTQTVAQFFATFPVSRGLQQYARNVITRANTHLTPFCAKACADGVADISILGNPASELSAEAKAALDAVVQCYKMVVVLQLHSLLRNFEQAVAECICADLEAAVGADLNKFFETLRTVTVRTLMLPRLISMPRHAVARIVTSVFSSHSSVAQLPIKRAIRVS
jgi:hypothetical protein